MRFSGDKVESARNFANKIWNASRFVLMNMGDEAETLEGKTLCAADQWILTRLNDTIREVSAHFEDYDLGLAAQKTAISRGASSATGTSSWRRSA